LLSPSYKGFSVLSGENKTGAVLIGLGRGSTNDEYLFELSVPVKHIGDFEVGYFVDSHTAAKKHPDYCDISTTKVASGCGPEDMGKLPRTINYLSFSPAMLRVSK
jgi:hypothetical protein